MFSFKIQHKNFQDDAMSAHISFAIKMKHFSGITLALKLADKTHEALPY
jgi:hypothetical protein